MLVLSRKNGQKIIIGDDIEIVVIESNHNNVKLGIEAPKDITVYREEIWRDIKDSNSGARQTDFDALDELTSMIKTDKNSYMKKKNSNINKALSNVSIYKK